MQQANTANKASKVNAINYGEGNYSLNSSNNQMEKQQQYFNQQQIKGQTLIQQQQQAMNQQQLSSGVNNGASQQQNQSAASVGQTAPATIGQGTINQQKLKSHVQQLVNRIRKESDQFYKKFVEICKNYRDTEKCMEFHSEVGKLFNPYGDLIGEINNVLHSDYQYNIPESSKNTTLKDSAISNSNVQRSSANADSSQNKNAGSAISSSAKNEGEIGKKKENNADLNISTDQGSNAQNAAGAKKQENKQQSMNQKKLVTQKLQEFCQVINVECPDKMHIFVSALRQKLDGQDDQHTLFIQTCKEIFSEDHSIYQKAQTLFQDSNLQESFPTQSESSPQQQVQSQSNNISQPVAPKDKKSEKHGKKKNISNAPASINASTQNPSNSNNINGNNLEKISNQNNNNTNQTGIQSANLNLTNQTNANGINKTSINNNATIYAGTPNGNTLNVNNYRAPQPSARGDDFTHQSIKHVPDPDHPKTLNIAGATKNEQNFIYLIDNHMDPIAFMNMLKLLYLYVECIITASEMIEQGSYLLQGFNNPDKLIEQLKDLVECRESSRRKATPYFKPLNDFDFNHHERFTHSYVEMPKFYPKYCSNSSKLTKSVLNTSIVTVPQGTEHVTFSIMRKNQYEEQLFKSEDEKYEFDHHIQVYRQTIRLLEQIETCENPEQCRRLMQQAIDHKMIMCLYKNGSPEQQEICEILLANPKKTVSVTLDRVKNKLREIEEAKLNQARKQWHEVAEKNFHRSLDHRSFIFKRHDRKFTLQARFEKEPEFRNRMIMRITSYLTHQQQQQQQLQFQQQQAQQLLQQQQGATRSAGAAMAVKTQNLQSEEGIENNQDFETDVSQYFQFLNTFQGTTSVEKCSHALSEGQLIKFDYMSTLRKFALPMMTFIFEDPDICEDTFSILMHYQLYAAINQSEREKIKRTAQMVLKGYFNLSFKSIEQTDITINENKTIKIVTEIENKIFEKIYAYLRPTNREGTGNDAQTNEKIGKGQDGEAIEEEEIDDLNAANNDDKDADKAKNDNKAEEEIDEEEDEKENQNADQKSEKKKTSSNNVNEQNKISQPGQKDKNSKSPSNANLLSQSKKQQSKDSNENEMEIENEGKQKLQDNGDEPSPVHENQANNNQGSLNEILDDENSKSGGETVREMNYFLNQIDENVYLPKQEVDNMQVFYGTKNLYIFIRFFYVLYERLFKAQEISRYFEDNEKTCKLTEQEKEDLSRERYATFKNILIGSLKQRETKYEDYLRSIFGKQAFLLFTIDKTLQSATKSLQALSSDELSQKLLQMYIHPEEFSLKNSVPSREEIIHVKMNKIILDSTLKNNTTGSDNRSFFRFSLDQSSKILYINYIDSYYKNWDLDQINKSRDYFSNFMTEPTSTNQNKSINSELPIYLSRNKAKNSEKIKSKQLQVFQYNNIEYLSYPNSNHIISQNNGKEDYLVSSSKLKRRSVPLEEVIAVEYKKKLKFDSWYNKQSDSIIQYKNASSKSTCDSKNNVKKSNNNQNNTNEESTLIDQTVAQNPNSSINQNEKAKSTQDAGKNITEAVNTQGSSANSSEMKSE